MQKNKKIKFLTSFQNDVITQDEVMFFLFVFSILFLEIKDSKLAKIWSV